jgi:hypothetical protein
LFREDWIEPVFYVSSACHKWFNSILMCCDLSTYDQYLLDITEQTQLSQSQKSTFTVLRSVLAPFEKK